MSQIARQTKLVTLARRNSPLAQAHRQVEILEQQSNALPSFDSMLRQHDLPVITSRRIEALQVNVGKLCNQTCAHCHVDAGPDRREIMSRETAEACLRVLLDHDIATLDITGGAPEMNPNFRWMVSEARRAGRHVIDRCNLTILLARGYENLPQFLADHQVEIVASLPCYLEENCDRQRGSGVFKRSIEALQRLNELGYGHGDERLRLCLVYNPTGWSLPPDQAKLESDYRQQLRDRFGIEFTQLYTITNMPISRFLDDLLQQGQYDAYMQRLIEAFNPLAVDQVMCRSMISVDWQGRLYDCDFNQMLDLGVASWLPQHISDFNAKFLDNRPIITSRHCFGCTAGAGSSCQGILT